MKARRIFLLVDAMGWEVARRHHAFETLAPHRRPLGTVLGYSSGAIPTILSGRLPEEHGHWALFPRALHGSPFAWTRVLRFLLPPSWQHRYRVRRLIREATRRGGRIRGYFQIYDVPLWLLPRLDYTEKRDLWSAGGLAPLQGVFDRWDAEGRRYFSSRWEGPDEAKFDRALEAAADPSIGTFLIYATELDALMHRVGTHDAEVGALVRRYEDRLQELMRRAGEHGGGGEVRTWIFSDHGMTDTLASHDLMSRVAALGLHEGRDYLAFYDSTMARIWIERPEAEGPLRALLSSLDYGRLVGAEELRGNGLGFPDRRYGDLIFLMHAGHLIAPSYMGQGAPCAMHGFDPQDPDSPGALLGAQPLPERLGHIRNLYSLLVEPLDEATSGAAEPSAEAATAQAEPSAEAATARLEPPG